MRQENRPRAGKSTTFPTCATAAPLRTPRPTIDKLNAALAADFKRPETAERFKALDIVAQWNTPAEFAAFITEQSAKWGKVIRAAGIEPQ